MIPRAFTTCLRWTCAAAVAVSTLVAIPAHAADHRDGPRLTDINNTPQGALDLNDLFMFVSPANKKNLVMIQTMSPGAGVVGPATFYPGAFYDLRISNDGNKLTDEIIFRTVFSEPNSAGQQTYQIRRFDGATDNGIVATGTTNGKVAKVKGGGTATAGIYDDPFFFDVNATARFNRELTIQALHRTMGFPYPPDINDNTDPTRHFKRPNFPNNFFGGFNTLAIALELPKTRVLSSRTNPTITAYLATVADVGDGRGFAQFDRTAVPSINTVLIPLRRTTNGEFLPNGKQDEFNFNTPEQDLDYIPIVIDRMMTVFGTPQEQAEAIANLFLPDVAQFNTSDATGFPNGRRLQDDVIDLELRLITNNLVTTDRVVNDSYYRKKFPYIGLPNPITTVINASLASIRAEREAARKNGTLTRP